MRHSSFGIVIAVLVVGCGSEQWPSPPIVEQTKYEADYRAWRETQQGLISDALSIVGVWPLDEGETAFGSDETLPIVLPLNSQPNRAGVLRRDGAMISVVPSPDSALRLADGRPVREAITLSRTSGSTRCCSMWLMPATSAVG